jgi:3-phenylpropionate/trans-cinnamate dioxygenase ferredoxin reductase subunit
MSEPGVVLVGAGLAAAHVASTIRDADDQRPVTIIGDEGRRPYERPGLSKGVLQGKDEPDSVYVHDTGWYEQNDIQTRFDDPAVAIDLAERKVRLASGESVEYADLVIATGARPRTIDLPGAGLPGVRTLRRIPDSLALREVFGEGRRLVVIGAGWIGLEVAAAATEAGTQVTVLESADVPLRAALGDRLGTYFAQLHRNHGVDLRTGITVSGIEGGDAVTGVRAGGELFPADLVVVGVGAVPNTELAQKAGLTVDNGIVVDEHLRAREHVYAIGDVANASNAALGMRVRVEHWDNAIRQGNLAGRQIRRGRHVQLAAVLLHRPVRPRHGVRGPRRSCRRCSPPGQRAVRGVHRLLAAQRPGHRCDERQHLGRQRHPARPHRPPDRERTTGRCAHRNRRPLTTRDG